MLMLISLRRAHRRALPALLLAAAASAACAPEIDTIDSVRATLETELGGYQLDEEVPMFGRTDLNLRALERRPRLPAIPALGYADRPVPLAAPGGMLVGGWVDLAKGYGVMAGKWANDRGQIVGHLEGVYGRSALYEDWIFLGKVVDRHGVALGLLAGRHVAGLFRGTIVDEAGRIRGSLRGHATADGRFAGAWQSELEPTVTARGVGEIPWRLLR